MTKHLKTAINYFLGPLLLILLSWTLYQQILNKQQLAEQWQQIVTSFTAAKLWLVVGMMLLNWSIEAKKWQLLVKHLQQFTFYRAVKSVLSGCSVSMLTPNRVGEFAGRVIHLKEGNRIAGISLTIVGGISQLLVTLLMGCIGLFYLQYYSQTQHTTNNVLPVFWEKIITSLSVGITILLALFYLRIAWLVSMMEKVPALQKVVKHIRILDEFNNTQLLQILSLSLLRYCIFITQYILLLQVMQVHIEPLLCFWLLSIFYLVIAVVPTFGFIELPVRASASYAILKLFTPNVLGVGAAAMGIWLINLVIPAVIGSLLILRFKMLKEK